MVFEAWAGKAPGASAAGLKLPDGGSVAAMDDPKITELPPSLVTVLQCHPGHVRLHRGEGLEPQPRRLSTEVSRDLAIGKWFYVAGTETVRTIFELDELLKKYRPRKDYFIIRGVLHPTAWTLRSIIGGSKVPFSRMCRAGCAG